MKFPSVLLESSCKITYEAPPGIKKNLLRTFESWSAQWFESGATQGGLGSTLQNGGHNTSSHNKRGAPRMLVLPILEIEAVLSATVGQ